eukprot:6600836-Prorocentrum_lima.AAC.1
MDVSGIPCLLAASLTSTMLNVPPPGGTLDSVRGKSSNVCSRFLSLQRIDVRLAAGAFLGHGK